MVIVELSSDCGDAMGANAVNTMAEAVAPLVEEISGGNVYPRIISNLADRRLVRARRSSTRRLSEGRRSSTASSMLTPSRTLPLRCATHNKGIMNGVIAVARACGQDTRALEAGAHSYAGGPAGTSL